MIAKMDTPNFFKPRQRQIFNGESLHKLSLTRLLQTDYQKSFHEIGLLLVLGRQKKSSEYLIRVESEGSAHPVFKFLPQAPPALQFLVVVPEHPIVQSDLEGFMRGRV